MRGFNNDEIQETRLQFIVGRSTQPHCSVSALSVSQSTEVVRIKKVPANARL